MTVIRKIEMADLPTLISIGRKTLIESHGHSAPEETMLSYLDEKFTEEALSAELADKANIFHMIYYNMQAAGYSKIIYNTPHPAVPHTNITKMERLYLLAAFHDLKLGRNLMQFNIELAKEQAQKGIWLAVWKENPRAISFYERAGFTIVGEGLFRLTDEHQNPNWIMYLDLDKT